MNGFAEFMMTGLTNLIYMTSVVALFSELEVGKLALKTKLLLIGTVALVQVVIIHWHQVDYSLVSLSLLTVSELLAIILVLKLIFRHNYWYLMGLYCLAYLFFSIVPTMTGTFGVTSVGNGLNLLVYLKSLVPFGLMLGILSGYIIYRRPSFLKKVRLIFCRKAVIIAAMMAYGVNRMGAFVIKEHALGMLRIDSSASSLVVMAFMITFYFLLVMLTTTEVNHHYQHAQIMTGQTTILQQATYMKRLEAIQAEMGLLQNEYQKELSRGYLDGSDEWIKEGHAQLLNGVGEAYKEIELNIRQTTRLSAIGVDDIRSLVFAKLVEMENRQITFSLVVENEIKECWMPVTDLVRCLGILLDNAMEAVACLREPEVIMGMIQKEEELVIMVQNLFGESELTEEIWQSGFSTKGDNRGLGLASYQKIVNKCHNVERETKIEGDCFTQIMTISSYE